MGQKRQRQRKNGFAQPPQRSINQRRVKQLRHQIEVDLCNAVTQGYLSEVGVLLAYRKEHLPELPFAAELYQKENPEDTVSYNGWDGERYVVQIRPSLRWLFTIQNLVPNLTFERVGSPPGLPH